MPLFYSQRETLRGWVYGDVHGINELEAGRSLSDGRIVDVIKIKKRRTKTTESREKFGRFFSSHFNQSILSSQNDHCAKMRKVGMSDA